MITLRKLETCFSLGFWGTDPIDILPQKSENLLGFFMADRAVILLAADQEADILLIQRAFHKAELTDFLTVVRGTAETISYLSGEGKYADRSRHPFPVCVLLGMSTGPSGQGHVLEWVRQQPTMAGLRIIVLTSQEHLGAVVEQVSPARVRVW